MIVCKDLVKRYPGAVKGEEVIALNHINLVLPDKGFIAVYGASGCGKSTLLNVLGGLDQASSGEMIVNGRSTKGFGAHDWNSYRNQEVGFVFQNYFLLPHLNVFDNIAVTLQMAKQTDNLSEKIYKALEEVDLAKYAKRYPRQLSGGQQQRVAIARALIANPSIILADEPTGALDEKSSKMVMKTLKEVSKDHLVVMVTHNERMAHEYADRLIEISYGNIIEDTAPLTEDKVDKTHNKELSSVHLPYGTSVKWSFRNVIKKKGRSIPIAIASGLGLAGVGVVLSMTRGVNDYVMLAQKEAIKDYPVYVSCYPKNSAESNEANLEEFPNSSDIIIEKSDYKAQEHYITMEDRFIEYMSGLKEGVDYSHVSTNQSVRFNLLTESTNDTFERVDSRKYTTCIAPATTKQTYDFLQNDMYDIIAGDHLPQNEHELTLVVDTYNRVDLKALEKMGFDTSQDSIKAADIINKKKYRIVSNDDYFIKGHPKDGTDEVMARDIYVPRGSSYDKEMYDNATFEMSIVSIIRPKKQTNNPIYSNVLIYHPNLMDFLLNENTGLNTKSEVVQAQIANREWSVITGEDFVDSYENEYHITANYLYESALVTLGGKSRVTSYYYYTDTFEQRTKIVEYAKAYEFDADSSISIKTKDYLETVTSSFTSVIKTFSTIMMAFSFVSVLISMILTAILTYISVIERKREIGLLRSLGARQRDVSLMFIFEAVIIGIVAGVLAVGLCYAFTPIASRIIVGLIDMANTHFMNPSVNQFANVQWWVIPTLFVAALAVGIIASLVPAVIAGHKKPAEALKE